MSEGNSSRAWRFYIDDPDVPWRLMVATRNRLIHGYLGIDNDTVWSIITVDIQTLLASLQALKNSTN